MRWSITLLLMFAGVPPPLGARSSPSVLPFWLAGNGAIVVPVTIEGHGPFRFLLDTGSSRSAISSELATRLRRPSVGQTMMVTPSGRVKRPVTRLERVVLGTAPSISVLAMILPAADLRAGAVHGLIGQDVLSALTYTIDYNRRQLIWHSTPDTGVSGTRLPLEWKEGRVLVSLSQRSTARSPLRLIPDSGTAGVVLFARRDRDLPPVTPLDVVVLRTLAGQRVVRRVLLDELDVGEIRLRDQLATVVDASPDLDIADGLLPLHLFARVTINGPGRYLIVER